MTFKLVLLLLFVSNFLWMEARSPRQCALFLNSLGGFLAMAPLLSLLIRKKLELDYKVMSHQAFRLVYNYYIIYPSYTGGTKTCHLHVSLLVNYFEC